LPSGEEFTYIEFNQDSTSGSWSYKVTSEGSYGIYIDNINDEEITIWFEIIRTEPVEGISISFGSFFLCPAAFGIISLIIIIKRRKSNSN